MVKVTVVKPAELPEDHIVLWRSCQADDPILWSPFFCPEYIEIAGSVFPRVRVGIVEEGGKVIGFFPFQLNRLNVAKRVGLDLCDLSGVIARKDSPWNAEDIVRSCGLSSWDFANVPAAQGWVRPFHHMVRDSPYIDLRNGYEAYEAERHHSGSSLVSDLRKRARKLEREVGPLRFEFHSEDDAAFQSLISWKSAQRRRTRTADALYFRWAHEFIRRVRAHNSPEFSGVLTTMYVGDKLGAVHFGMRSRWVMHYWFPTFNRALERYSPGAIMLLEVAKMASAAGIRRIDFGPGEEFYKARFTSSGFPLAAGAVDCTLGRKVLTEVWYRARTWSYSSLIGGTLRSAKQVAKRAYYRSAAFVEDTR